MENDAFRILRFQSQYLIQMPGYGLSLPVLIGSQPNLVGFLRFVLQLGHEFLLVGGYHVLRGVIVLEVYTEIFRLQVADMTVARHNLVVRSEELLDGFCLGG